MNTKTENALSEHDQDEDDNNQEYVAVEQDAEDERAVEARQDDDDDEPVAGISIFFIPARLSSSLYRSTSASV